MNRKVATLTASALLVLASITGCGASAPSQEAAVTPTAASHEPSATSTPTPAAKPSQAFVAAPMAPEDPAVIKQISELKVCSMAVFMDKLWGSVAVNPKVPAEHQARAADYVTKIEAKKAELGC